MTKWLVSRLQHPITYVVYVVLLCSVVFFTSIQSGHPFITPDSSYYLEEAIFIARNGFIQGLMESDFTCWPLGYPFSIALFMDLFNISALLASKFVNVFFLFGCFVILWLQFKRQSILYAFIFSHVLVLTLFRYTWSESGFVFFEFLAFYSAQRLIVSNSLKSSIFLLIGCLGILIMRYSGIFIFPWLLWLIFHYYVRQGLLNVRIIVVLLMLVIFEILYGIRNIEESAFWFGCNRAKDANGIVLNIFFLFRAMLQQLSFIAHAKSLLVLISAVLIQLFVFVMVKQRISDSEVVLHTKLSSAVWFSGGFFSFMCVVLIKFFVSFDDFNYRILLPGLLPLYVVLLNKLIVMHNEYYSKAILVLLSFSLMSLICFTQYL